MAPVGFAAASAGKAALVVTASRASTVTAVATATNAAEMV